MMMVIWEGRSDDLSVCEDRTLEIELGGLLVARPN